MSEGPPGTEPTSYSDRYRGTPWGRPEPPPPPPPSRTPLLIAGVLVVAIVGSGIGLVALFNGGGPALPGTTSAPVGIATASPTVPARLATPSPTADPGKAVLLKFWALVSPPDTSYHMTAKGKTRLDGKTVQTYSESLDIVADEYSGTITSKVNGKAQIARKDGVIYAKKPGQPRGSRRTDMRYARLTPFLYLTMAAWMDYVKPVTIGGQPLHQLRSNRFYRPDIARMIDVLKFPVEPDRMNLDVYVRDDGTPVSATFTVDVEVSDSKGLHKLHSRTDFVFSKFGAKFTIKIPKA